MPGTEECELVIPYLYIEKKKTLEYTKSTQNKHTKAYKNIASEQYQSVYIAWSNLNFNVQVVSSINSVTM